MIEERTQRSRCLAVSQVPSKKEVVQVERQALSVKSCGNPRNSFLRSLDFPWACQGRVLMLRGPAQVGILFHLLVCYHNK